MSHALTGTMGKRHDPDTDTLVAHTLTKDGADASEDGTGRETPLVVAPAVAVPLTSGSHPNSSAPSRHREDDTNLVVYRKSRNAQTNEDDETWVPDDEANTLNTFDGGDKRAKELVLYAMMPTSEGKYFTAREADVAQPLTSAAGQVAGNQGGDVLLGSSVRRLTPTECERLQGFPDGWTCLCGANLHAGLYSTEWCRCPDGPRYAAIGNAVTVNVAQWIGERIAAAVASHRANKRPTFDGLKAKDLVGIPWRVAFALQADGWYLRSDIVWSKPNPMPESVTDRPTKAHEYVFLMTKSAHYFYDAEAITEPVSESTHMRVSQDVANQVGS